MIEDYGLRGKVTFAKHIGTNPMKVLEAIKVHLLKDSNFDERWIVIDKDSYSKSEFNGTLASAKSLNINVAYANEAYELWILLHFKEQKAYINRFQLNKELKNLVDYEKNNAIYFSYYSFSFWFTYTFFKRFGDFRSFRNSGNGRELCSVYRLGKFCK